MLQLKEALAYGSYMICTTFLPNAVNVVTLYYGTSAIVSLARSFGLFILCSYCLFWFLNVNSE